MIKREMKESGRVEVERESRIEGGKYKRIKLSEL